MSCEPPAAALSSSLPGPVTLLLQKIGEGESGAVDRLFALLYEELHRIARRQLRSSREAPTLNTTALVHEAYLKLSNEARWSVRDRAHFYALAGRAMRELLIDHARTRGRKKRGGGVVPLSLESLDVPVAERADELLALDSALERLEAVDPELARLVEWRFFAGLSHGEIAELLDVSERTIKRHWRSARAFLYQELAVSAGPA